MGRSHHRDATRHGLLPPNAKEKLLTLLERQTVKASLIGHLALNILHAFATLQRAMRRSAVWCAQRHAIRRQESCKTSVCVGNAAIEIKKLFKLRHFCTGFNVDLAVIYHRCEATFFRRTISYGSATCETKYFLWIKDRSPPSRRQWINT
jgi:hypothetical protein